MLDLTDVIRIRDIRPLNSPATIIAEFPRSGRASDIVTGVGDALHRILQRHDDRLAVIIGPCSIHDPDAALEYAIVGAYHRAVDA